MKKSNKKKVVSKKAKKPVSKKSTARSKVANPKQKKVPETKPVEVKVEPIPPAPTRAPLRKIIGAGNSVTIVEKTPQEVAPPAPSAPLGKLTLVPVKEPVKRPEMPKLPWNELPSSVPAHLRYLLTLASKECEAASTWPLPFAKFLSNMPQNICGRGIALLTLNLDQDSAQIAEICDMSVEDVDQLLEQTRTTLEEGFSTSCKDMYRKWTSLLADSSKTVHTNMDSHFIPKVDRNFQILVGELLLKSIGDADGSVIGGKFVRKKNNFEQKSAY